MFIWTLDSVVIVILIGLVVFCILFIIILHLISRVIAWRDERQKEKGVVKGKMKDISKQDIVRYFNCGQRRSDIGFNIGKLKWRRKPVLFVEYDEKVYKVGQFKDEQTAYEFMQILDYVMLGNKEDKARDIIAGWEGDQDESV